MLDSQAGRSVLANTSYTLLLRQKPAMIKSVQNVFNLSEAEKIMLLTARPGEGLLLMEDDHSEIRIIASEKEHQIITTNADELLKQKSEEIIQSGKSTKSKIKLDQRAYLKKNLDKADLKFLISSRFKEVRQTNISGKKETYLVISNKNESSNHIICVKEISDYLRQFTQDIKTYRTSLPDIVFEANGKEYAIEVETGEIIKHKKKIQEKLSLLKEKFGKNWFFFVTNRNLEKRYSKLGVTAHKRNIKFKINQIFKKNKK